MTQSNFVNPDGWDNNEQYTTVADLIKITEYTLYVPEIMEITGKYQKHIKYIQVKSLHGQTPISCLTLTAITTAKMP